VKLAGRDADLAAEAELAAVGELGRGVPEHDGAVDAAEKALGSALIGGDDGIGVLRAEAGDVLDRLVDAGDGLDGNDSVEELAAVSD
jgi:hypothetical protein